MKKILTLGLACGLLFAALAGCASKASQESNAVNPQIADVKDKDALYAYLQTNAKDYLSSNAETSDLPREAFDSWNIFYLDITGDGSEEAMIDGSTGTHFLQNFTIISGDSDEFKRIPADISLAKYENTAELQDGFLAVKQKNGGSGTQTTYMSLYVYNGSGMTGVLEDLVLSDRTSAPNAKPPVDIEKTAIIDGTLTDFVYTLTSKDLTTGKSVVEQNIQYTFDKNTLGFKMTPLEIETPAQSTGTNPYIGLTFSNDNIPDGVVENGGFLYNFTEPQTSEYACTLMSKDGLDMLWLERLTGRNAQGIAEFEVVDVVALPEQDYVLTTFLLKDGASCEGFGLAKNANIDEEYFKEFYKAWKVNPQTEKLEEIPTEGLQGENPGYGV